MFIRSYIYFKCEIDSKEDCPTSSEVVELVLKDNEAEKLPLSDEKACVEKEDVASSTPTKDSIFEVNGGSGANETDTVEHSDRQVYRLLFFNNVFLYL